MVGMAVRETIQVLVLEPEASIPGRRMVPGVGQVAARIMDVAIEAVKNGFREVIEQVSEMFIVAHEFAHLILRHYDSDRPTSTRRLAADAEVERIQTRKEDEYEADRLGLEILRDHHRQIGLSDKFTRVVVCFLFGCLTTFENTAVLEGMVVQAETHPTSSDRLNRLLQQLAEEEGIPPDAPTDPLSVYRVMEQLWVHNVNRYLEMRELAINGTVPWDGTAPYRSPYGNDTR
jgi:hypothetical protein